MQVHDAQVTTVGSWAYSHQKSPRGCAVHATEHPGLRTLRFHPLVSIHHWLRAAPEVLIP